MKRIALLFLLSLSIASQAQNLITDGSFEKKECCPGFECHFPLTEWENCYSNEGVNYMNKCRNTSFLTELGPARGDGCVAMKIAIKTNQNEIANDKYYRGKAQSVIQTKLRAPLEKGKVYSLRVKLTPTTWASTVTNIFQFSLNHTKVDCKNLDWKFNTYYTYRHEDVFADTLVWTSVFVNYKALGGEEFFSFGSIANYPEVKFRNWPASAEKYVQKGGYYAVDDILLVETNYLFSADINWDSLKIAPSTTLALSKTNIEANGKLTEDFRAELKQLAEYLKANPKKSISLKAYSYSDKTGKNEAISAQLATDTKEYLAAQGIDKSKISTWAKGSLEPIFGAFNSYSEQPQRVEIVFD